MAALIVLPLAQAAAQTAVPVQNIDEPGRNPYQEYHVSFTPGEFALVFQAVPAGKRRVITHVNCQVNVQTGKTLSGADLSPTVANSQQEVLPPLSTMPNGASTRTIFGENPQMYVEAGGSPVIAVSTNDNQPFIACRLSGYDVDLNTTSPPPPS
jgi:hypothetical protein